MKEDFILRHLEINERYHDTKEKMLWLAGTAYLAFSITVLNLMIRYSEEIAGLCRQKKAAMMLFLFAVFFLYAVFICFQSTMKVACSKRTYGWQEAMKELDYDPSYRRILHLSGRKTRFTCIVWLTHHFTGITVILISLLFFIAKIALLLH